MTNTPAARNVLFVMGKLSQRSAIGVAKRQDIDLAGRLRHLQEELLDAAVDIEAALNKIEGKGQANG